MELHQAIPKPAYWGLILVSLLACAIIIATLLSYKGEIRQCEARGLVAYPTADGWKGFECRERQEPKAIASMQPTWLNVSLGV